MFVMHFICGDRDVKIKGEKMLRHCFGIQDIHMFWSLISLLVQLQVFWSMLLLLRHTDSRVSAKNNNTRIGWNVSVNGIYKSSHNSLLDFCCELWLGHSNTLICFDLNHSCVAPAGCLWLLSSCKGNLHPVYDI